MSNFRVLGNHRAASGFVAYALMPRRAGPGHERWAHRCGWCFEGHEVKRLQPVGRYFHSSLGVGPPGRDCWRPRYRAQLRAAAIGLAPRRRCPRRARAPGRAIDPSPGRARAPGRWPCPRRPIVVPGVPAGGPGGPFGPFGPFAEPGCRCRPPAGTGGGPAATTCAANGTTPRSTPASPRWRTVRADFREETGVRCAWGS